MEIEKGFLDAMNYFEIETFTANYTVALGLCYLNTGNKETAIQKFLMFLYLDSRYVEKGDFKLDYIKSYNQEYKKKKDSGDDFYYNKTIFR